MTRLLTTLAPCAALALAACGDDTPAGDGDDTGSTGTTAPPGTESGQDPTTGVDSSDDGTGPGPAAFCAGPTSMLYDPIGGQLDAYPDDFYTVAADTPTGRQVDLRVGGNVLLSGNAETFARVFDGASTLDGFGTTAGVYVQFDGPLDETTLPESGDGSGTPDASLLLVRLDVDPPELVDVQLQLTPEDPGDGRTTVVMRPMVPLASAARYGVAVKQTLLDADGECIAPSPVMTAVLEDAADPELDVAAEGAAAVVDALSQLGAIESVFELSGAVAFTTQTTIVESATIAEQIRAAASPTYAEVTPCTDPDPMLPYEQCDGTFTADDYTGPDGVVDPSLSPQSQYDIPVVVYVPKAGTAPFPTMVYGHGLAGDRFQAAALAEFAAPLGLAVVAIDAPKHGDHPDAAGFNAVLDFFGLSLNFSDPLDALVLRDNFRQGAYDRLQLVQMLRAGVDLGGSPEPELDADALHYLGVSLGGLMGPQLVAFAPEFDTAIFIVPGARVTNIVAEGDQFSVVVDLFSGMATDGEIARFFPVLQGVVDRGDAGTFARAVVDRLPGFDDASPQVLIQMVEGDDTVPNSANTYFARSVGVPHVGEEIFPIGTVAREPELPVTGNLDATHTGGSFQYDVIVGDDGTTTEPATHGNVARSTLSQLQITTFLDSFVQSGVAQIIDPYAELGVR